MLPTELPDLGTLAFCDQFSPAGSYLVARAYLDPHHPGFALFTPQGNVAMTLPYSRLQALNLTWAYCPSWQADEQAFYFLAGNFDEETETDDIFIFKYSLPDDTLTQIVPITPLPARSETDTVGYPQPKLVVSPRGTHIAIQFRTRYFGVYEIGILFPTGELIPINDLSTQGAFPIGAYPVWGVPIDENQFPVANAGSDQAVTASATGTASVTLNGYGSSDSDGTITAYRWYENDIQIAEGMTPQVELGIGEHTITLTVEDDDGATASDDVIITVEPASGCNPTAPSDTPTHTVAAGDITGLIAAINASNTNTDPDIIALEEDTYTLSTVNNTGLGTNGLPLITTPITFHGNCATIERDPAAEAFRFFQVDAGGELTLYDLTLTGGATATLDNTLPESDGGAIYSQGATHLNTVTLANNSAFDDGGAVYSTGTLDLTSSTFTANGYSYSSE